MPLYVSLGGLNTTLALVTLWLSARVFEAAVGDRTWLPGLKDYLGELSCFGLFVIAILLNVLLHRGITGVLHLCIVCRYFAALFIICSYSRVPIATPERFALSVLLVLGLFALISMPTLIARPMLPRLTQFDDELYLSLLYKGVTRYSSYTAEAIVFPCFLVAAAGTHGIVRKCFFGALCLGIAFVVTISGFMAAVVTLVVSLVLLFLLLLWRRSKAGWTSRRKLAMILTACLIVGGAFLAGTKSEGLDFAMEKAQRLVQGILTEGLAKGDETGRYELLELSVTTFRDMPWFGIGPVTGDLTEALYGSAVGGHASLIDGLAEYGVVGFGWYLLLLGLLSRRVLLGVRFGKNRLFSSAVGIVWLAFLATSIYNVTTWVPDIVVLVFGFVLINSFPHCLMRPAATRFRAQSVAISSVPPERNDNRPGVIHYGSG